MIADTLLLYCSRQMVCTISRSLSLRICCCCCLLLAWSWWGRVCDNCVHLIVPWSVSSQMLITYLDESVCCIWDVSTSLSAMSNPGNCLSLHVNQIDSNWHVSRHDLLGQNHVACFKYWFWYQSGGVGLGTFLNLFMCISICKSGVLQVD